MRNRNREPNAEHSAHRWPLRIALIVVLTHVMQLGPAVLTHARGLDGPEAGVSESGGSAVSCEQVTIAFEPASGEQTWLCFASDEPDPAKGSPWLESRFGAFPRIDEPSNACGSDEECDKALDKQCGNAGKGNLKSGTAERFKLKNGDGMCVGQCTGGGINDYVIKICRN